MAGGKLPDAWVSRPRFHHQYLPDVVQYESDAFDVDLADTLQGMGHTLKALDSTYGNMQAILHERKSGKVYAASDPRGVGMSAVSVRD